MGFGIYWRQQIGHPVADSSLILFLLTCCRRCSQGLGNCRCPRDWSSFHLVLMVLQSDPKKRTMLFSHMMHVNSSVVESAVAMVSGTILVSLPVLSNPKKCCLLPIPALPFMTYYNKRGQAMPPSPAGVTTSFNIVNKFSFAQFQAPKLLR